MMLNRVLQLRFLVLVAALSSTTNCSSFVVVTQTPPPLVSSPTPPLSLLLPQRKSASTKSASSSSSKSTQLCMAPRFDVATNQWIATQPDEESSAGYPPTKTLLLAGPKPFLHRLLQPDDYNQAVLKFMAGDQVDRNTAQGNMDAYLENPNDWAYQRFEDEKRGNLRRDYTTINSKQLALTLTWAGLVISAILRSVIALSTDTPFWSFLPWMQ